VIRLIGSRDTEGTDEECGLAKEDKKLKLNLGSLAVGEVRTDSGGKVFLDGLVEWKVTTGKEEIFPLFLFSFCFLPSSLLAAGAGEDEFPIFIHPAPTIRLLNNSATPNQLTHPEIFRLPKDSV